MIWHWAFLESFVATPAHAVASLLCAKLPQTTRQTKTTNFLHFDTCGQKNPRRRRYGCHTVTQSVNRQPVWNNFLSQRSVGFWKWRHSGAHHKARVPSGVFPPSSLSSSKPGLFRALMCSNISHFLFLSNITCWQNTCLWRVDLLLIK